MDLSGKLLIAMPTLGDNWFQRSVVLMCRHSEEGAMGLIINKRARDLQLSDLLEQFEITPDPPDFNMPVHFGGPVETGRGFVLHSGEYRSQLQTLDVTGALGMTATIDILEDLATGKGPERALLMLGYAGWGPGQVESEITMNGWLTVDADADLIFARPDGEKWEAALGRLGVNPLTLSAAAGRA